MALAFDPPIFEDEGADHHADAAAGNVEATTQAIAALDDALSGQGNHKRILLRAAAGAGKSYALKRMVEHSLKDPRCQRVAVVAFANKQIFPLAEDLGTVLGPEVVCLFVAKDRLADVPDSTHEVATVVTKESEIPEDARVVVATSHKVGGFAVGRLQSRLGAASNGERIFDVLFVDEAWQLPLHRYVQVEGLAPVAVGVGDVGQLPPLDPGQNPWRGDPGYNPYRAWPTSFEKDAETWTVDLPAVWRPTAEQLPLWRAFYGEWDNLNCVAAPGDRLLEIGAMRGDAARIWQQVSTGVPTLVEVENLPDADAADVDLPLLQVVEAWIDKLLSKGFTLHERRYDDNGLPAGEVQVSSDEPGGRTMLALLATRNQAVDDATEVVDRLTERHDLPQRALVASTVDSWQGQTNAITVAVHPLSGASRLDAFNSAFGRLAVTCTRATHGLLLVSRAGLGELLQDAPPRPGTPLGEPGPRQLPRQTHARILSAFARGTVTL